MVILSGTKSTSRLTRNGKTLFFNVFHHYGASNNLTVGGWSKYQALIIIFHNRIWLTTWMLKKSKFAKASQNNAKYWDWMFMVLLQCPQWLFPCNENIQKKCNSNQFGISTSRDNYSTNGFCVVTFAMKPDPVTSAEILRSVWCP